MPPPSEEPARSTPINQRAPFDGAADFCAAVETPDLLTYLGLDETAGTAEAAEALKAHRKRMQGMQANPKFGKQAKLFIKGYNELQEALADLDAYRADVEQRRLAKNLPTLEVAIRSVLAGGTLLEDQRRFLHENAQDLRIADDVFESTLQRLVDEAKAAGTFTEARDGGAVQETVVQAGFPWLPVLGVAGLVLGGGVVAVIALRPILFPEPEIPPPPPPPPPKLVLIVDPGADRVLVDGKEVGKGASVVLEAPAAGTHVVEAIRERFQPLRREVAFAGTNDVEEVLELVPEKALAFKPDSKLKMGELPREAVVRVMAPRQNGLDACVQKSRSEAAEKEGRVRFHIGKDGRAIGVEVLGSAASEPAVQACLERQATLFGFDPLKDADYATLTYDYKVQRKTDP